MNLEIRAGIRLPHLLHQGVSGLLAHLRIAERTFLADLFEIQVPHVNLPRHATCGVTIGATRDSTHPKRILNLRFCSVVHSSLVQAHRWERGRRKDFTKTFRRFGLPLRSLGCVARHRHDRRRLRGPKHRPVDGHLHSVPGGLGREARQFNRGARLLRTSRHVQPFAHRGSTTKRFNPA